MNRTATLDTDHARGERAERLLRDDMLVDAFAKLEAEYIGHWKTMTDSAARDRLWMAVQIVGKVKSHLQSVAASGTLAKRELDDIAKFGERRKMFGIV